MAFSLALSLITGIIFGAAPAWLAAHTDVNEALKQGARGSTEGGARGRFRSALVVLEVAFALVLLGGAGLLARSFMQLTHVDPGFIPENATVLRLALPEKKYPQPEQQKAFVDSLLQRLNALPGVQAVGAAQVLPLIGDYSLAFEIEGRPESPAERLANHDLLRDHAGLFPRHGNSIDARSSLYRARRCAGAARGHHQRNTRPSIFPKRRSDRQTDQHSK